MLPQYVLWVIVITTDTGDVIERRSLSPPMSAEACLIRQADQGIRRPVDGKIAIFDCVAVPVLST